MMNCPFAKPSHFEYLALKSYHFGSKLRLITPSIPKPRLIGVGGGGEGYQAFSTKSIRSGVAICPVKNGNEAYFFLKCTCMCLSFVIHCFDLSFVNPLMQINIILNNSCMCVYVDMSYACILNPLPQNSLTRDPECPAVARRQLQRAEAALALLHARWAAVQQAVAGMRPQPAREVYGWLPPSLSALGLVLQYRGKST